MSESYADRIKRTRTIPEALLVVAEGIDAILAGVPVRNPPELDCGTPERAAARVAAFDELVTELAELDDDRGVIDSLEQALARETDSDERTALEARLRLARETGRAVTVEVPGPTLRVEDDVVEIPAPDQERFAERVKWIGRVDLNDFIEEPTNKLSVEDQHKGYVQGGPHWLYLYDRDAVMNMPPEWRVMFVHDVERDSPRLAQEMGRDILKDLGTGKTE